MDITFPSNQEKEIKKDSSLLKLNNKYNTSQENPILNKFIIKPNITKVNNQFLTEDKFEFLNRFKQSTEELLLNNEKQRQVNIENENEAVDVNKEKQYVNLDLNMGIFDIIPKNIQNDNLSTSTLESSCNLEALKNLNNHLNNQRELENNIMIDANNNNLIDSLYKDKLFNMFIDSNNLNSNMNINEDEDESDDSNLENEENNKINCNCQCLCKCDPE